MLLICGKILLNAGCMYGLGATVISWPLFRPAVRIVLPPYSSTSGAPVGELINTGPTMTLREFKSKPKKIIRFKTPVMLRGGSPGRLETNGLFGTGRP